MFYADYDKVFFSEKKKKNRFASFEAQWSMCTLRQRQLFACQYLTTFLVPHFTLHRSTCRPTYTQTEALYFKARFLFLFRLLFSVSQQPVGNHASQQSSLCPVLPLLPTPSPFSRVFPSRCATPSSFSTPSSHYFLLLFTENPREKISWTVLFYTRLVTFSSLTPQAPSFLPSSPSSLNLFFFTVRYSYPLQ